MLRPLLQPKRNMGKSTPAGPLDSKYLKYLGFNLVVEADLANRPVYAA
jgi:hypothetical protein